MRSDALKDSDKKTTRGRKPEDGISKTKGPRKTSFRKSSNVVSLDEHRLNKNQEHRERMREVHERRGDRTLKSQEDPTLRKLALDDLKRSGLDKADFRKLGLEVLTREQTDEFVGEPRCSYKIPYFDLDGHHISYSRVRFLESRKGKSFHKKKKSRDGSFRYSQPFNSSPHIYLPPYFNWRKIAKDPSIRVLITEGEKKAAAACKHGIPCIALGGVYGFKSQKRFFDILPELEAFIWKDREVEVCYDADVMMKAEVRAALSSLAITMTQSFSPASLSFVFLTAETAGPKTGLDDYLVEHGSEGFEKIERQPYKAAAKIQLLNTKICWVKNHGQFFDFETMKFYKNMGHLREAYMHEGEELTDGKHTTLIIDLWAKSANRRTVFDVVYQPGKPETHEGNFNMWKAPVIQPKKGNPKKWLELVNHIIRADVNPAFAEWFLKWLAYPVQNPGTKVFQAPFIYATKQGVGKTFIVDPVMEYIYGPKNFHRLGNNDVASVYNEYVGNKQFVVTNEIYLPDFSDRKAAMSTLRDMITREKVSVNEKFQPRLTLADFCNYYFTSNHADALILEPDDRRMFVIQAPDQRWGMSDYKELDKWLREEEGASVILHYLQNLDTADFEPKAPAPMTPWKKELIGLSRDALSEFIERLIDAPKELFMKDGNLPDLQLFRAEDLLRLFELIYPRYRFNVTISRIGRMLDNPGIEKRSVRASKKDPLMTLYAIFDRDNWSESANHEWATHYAGNSKLFGNRSRH